MEKKTLEGKNIWEKNVSEDFGNDGPIQCLEKRNCQVLDDLIYIDDFYRNLHGTTEEEKSMLAVLNQQSASRCCSMLDNMQEFIFILNKDKVIIDVYGQWIKNNNLSKMDFIGKNVIEALGNKGSNEHEKYIVRALEGKLISYEWVFETVEGNQFMQVSVAPIRSKEGEIIGVIAVNRDTSEHKYLQTILWQKLQELNCIYAISEYAYNSTLSKRSLIMDIPTLISLNWRYPEVVGVRIVLGEEYVSQNFCESQWCISEDIKQYGRIIGTIELFFSLKEEHENEWSLLTDDASALRTIADKISEVILHKELREELEKTNDRLEKVMERITDGFILLDYEGYILVLNHASGKILKRPREELLNKNLWNEFPSLKEKSIYNKFQRIMKRTFTEKCEEYIEIFEGWFQFKLFYSDEGIAIYIADITERKESEEKLKVQAKELQLMNKKLLQDLGHVRDTQLAFNQPMLKSDGLEILSYYEPYEKVGGDFINVVEIDEEHTAIYIGDVAGHGIPASLTSMFVHHQINGHKNMQHLDILKHPSKLLLSLHKNFNDSNFLNETYFVMFYAVYNKINKKLTYCTAGFNTEPILCGKSGEVKLLNESQGLPIGQFDFFDLLNYTDQEHKVGEGDILAIYTDGLEEFKATKVPYAERVKELVVGNRGGTLEGLKRKITKLIYEVGDGIKDDIAFLLVKFK